MTPLVRFEGLPGEFSQHDFGEVEVRYQDDRTETVHFFASRLEYSRWVEVTLVSDERVESLVRALVDHLAAFGGVPLASRSTSAWASKSAGRIGRKKRAASRISLAG